MRPAEKRNRKEVGGEAGTQARPDASKYLGAQCLGNRTSLTRKETTSHAGSPASGPAFRRRTPKAQRLSGHKLNRRGRGAGSIAQWFQVRALASPIRSPLKMSHGSHRGKKSKCTRPGNARWYGVRALPWYQRRGMGWHGKARRGPQANVVRKKSHPMALDGRCCRAALRFPRGD